MTTARRVEKVGPLRLYKSYSFVDKDPIIDRIRTMIADENMTYAKIEAGSGVCSSTLAGWMAGPVKRPQFATVMAVVRALGYDMQISQRHPGQRRSTSDIRTAPPLRVVAR